MNDLERLENYLKEKNICCLHNTEFSKVIVYRENNNRELIKSFDNTLKTWVSKLYIEVSL